MGEVWHHSFLTPAFVSPKCSSLKLLSRFVSTKKSKLRSTPLSAVIDMLRSLTWSLGAWSNHVNFRLFYDWLDTRNLPSCLSFVFSLCQEHAPTQQIPGVIMPNGQCSSLLKFFDFKLQLLSVGFTSWLISFIKIRISSIVIFILFVSSACTLDAFSVVYRSVEFFCHKALFLDYHRCWSLTFSKCRENKAHQLKARLKQWLFLHYCILCRHWRA